MDGQLGREWAASCPAPLNFPARSFTSSDETTWKSGHFGRHEASKQTKVMLVDAGGMVSAAVDQEGGLWLWGHVPPPSETPNSSPDNAESSFELTNVEKPERVRALMSTRVYRVACGNEHIIALVEGRDGAADLYSWGMNSYGQLGLGDMEPRAMPTLVATLAASQVGISVDIACGAFHTAVITVKDDDPSSENFGVPEASASPMRSKLQLGSPKHRGRQITEQYVDSPKLRSRPGERYHGAFPYPGVQHSNNISSINNGFSNLGSHFSTAYSDSSSSPKLSSRASSQVSMNGGSRMQGRPLNVGMDGHVSICWTFGQGENGQLGHGTTMNVNVPTAVTGLPSRERLRTVVCGMFHTGVVSETGDVWVWGMEGGLGLCPGIGPPGSKSGDALTPVRVFGESSAKCNPVSGSKGIACGAAHTITVSNNGKDLWAWGRGQSGVLGLGHASDSWFPCPVVWPPGSDAKDLKDQLPEMEPMYERKPSSRGSIRSKGGPVEDGRLQVKEAVEVDARPPRGKPVADFGRPLRRGDDYRAMNHDEQRYEDSPRATQKVYEDPRFENIRKALEESRFAQKANDDPRFAQKAHDDPRYRDYDDPREPNLRSRAMEDARAIIGSRENGTAQSSEDVSLMRAELDKCRRYAETLHTAVYGGLESFPYQQLFDGGNDSNSQQSRGIGNANANISPLLDWQRCIELAADQELVKLELFYKSMRNRIKDVMFQRRMEEWCRCCMSSLSTNQFQEPPPVRDPFSAQSTPTVEVPGEFAMRLSGILTDRGEMLPPAALAASLADFRVLSQRRR